MIKIDATTKNELFESVCKTAFEYLNLQGDCIVEVDFVSEEEIRTLNAQTRNVDRVTDVLSYPALDEIREFTKRNYPFEYDEEEKAVRLGNIIICNEQVSRQAKEYGHSETRESAYLFLHGILHLLGYDHIEEEDKVVMREKEEGILNLLQITR